MGFCRGAQGGGYIPPPHLPSTRVLGSCRVLSRIYITSSTYFCFTPLVEAVGLLMGPPSFHPLCIKTALFPCTMPQALGPLVELSDGPNPRPLLSCGIQLRALAPVLKKRCGEWVLARLPRSEVRHSEGLFSSCCKLKSTMPHLPSL